MLKEVKTFMCDFDCTPTDEDINFCIYHAKANDCIVELKWRMKWSGDYSRYIYSNSTFEQIKESLPKIYGI